MMSRRLRMSGALLAMAIVMVTAAPVSYAQTPGRFLGREDILLYGIGLQGRARAADGAARTSRRSSARSCRRRRCPTALPPFAPDAVVAATLRGPSFATPRELTAQPNTPFEIPPLTVAGMHTLDNIRLDERRRGAAARRRRRASTIDVIEPAGHAGHGAAADRRRDPREGHRLRSVELPGLQLLRGVRDRGRQPVDLNFPVVLPPLQGAADVTLEHGERCRRSRRRRCRRCRRSFPTR